MKNLLKRVFSGQPTEEGSSPEGKIVRVDLDEEGPNAQDEFKEAVSQISDITFFEGRVKHGYSLDHVSTKQECPRCQAPTQQYYAEWIYATQIAPRSMLAPAGYFCTRCPTVIVDEAMIQLGIKKNFRYRGVVGLDHDQGKSPDLFKTWNGEEAVHIFDERGIHRGLSTLGSTPSGRSTKSGRKTKSRRRRTKKRKSGKRSRRK